MKIGVTTFGGDGGRSGIGHYIASVLDAFARQGADRRFEVMHLAGEEGAFIPPSAPFATLSFNGPLRRPAVNLLWHQTGLPRLCRERGYDVLFVPAGNRRVPFRAPCPMVGTVHDFSSLHIPGKYDPARAFYIHHVLPGLVRRFTKVIAISRCTMEDLVARAGVPEERVRVIPQGVDHRRFHPGEGDPARRRVCGRYGIVPPYILYVARIEHPGKNHARLIRAFGRLKEKEGLPHQLVLAGPDRERADAVHREAARSAFARDIRCTGFVAADDLPDLYRGADLVAFPSLYEGFGLPVLEAMASGVPVACADVSSLPEVAGDAAVMFPPEDEEAMARALWLGLCDGALRDLCVRRGTLRAAGYTWEKTAAATLSVIDEAAALAPSAPRKAGRRVPLKALPGLDQAPAIFTLCSRRRFVWHRTQWLFRARGPESVKRGIDIVAAGGLLVLLSPLFALVAALVKLTDGGPVLFWQRRVGRHGREFAFPKFRSMVVDAEAKKAALLDRNDYGRSITFKMKRDPRVTWIGRIIRKVSIDELPQLWNVLNGEMTIVGPRPAVPNEVAQYRLPDRRRLDATPGLTCIWQVSGRGDIPFDRQVQMDVDYIESQTLWGDLKLMVRTIPAVLRGKGAY